MYSHDEPASPDEAAQRVALIRKELALYDEAVDSSNPSEAALAAWHNWEERSAEYVRDLLAALDRGATRG